MNSQTSFVTILLLFFATGCGQQGLERIEVSGRASYDKKPIETGQIRFIPVAPTQGPATIENIRDGKYETATSGGVPVGTHQVQLRMYDPEEYRTAPRTPGAPAIRQLLPEKYNRKSDLTLTVESGSGAIEHDFDLPK